MFRMPVHLSHPDASAAYSMALLEVRSRRVVVAHDRYKNNDDE
jgi:hypothetical protein